MSTTNSNPKSKTLKSKAFKGYFTKLAKFLKSAKPITKKNIWRVDVNKWEHTMQVLWCIKYYKYCIWQKGKLHTQYKLKQIPNPQYLHGVIISTVYVSRKEFAEKYNNNKWVIPINEVLDLNRP